MTSHGTDTLMSGEAAGVQTVCSPRHGVSRYLVDMATNSNRAEVKAKVIVSRMVPAARWWSTRRRNYIRIELPYWANLRGLWHATHLRHRSPQRNGQNRRPDPHSQIRYPHIPRGPKLLRRTCLQIPDRRRMPSPRSPPRHPHGHSH